MYDEIVSVICKWECQFCGSGEDYVDIVFVRDEDKVRVYNVCHGYCVAEQLTLGADADRLRLTAQEYWWLAQTAAVQDDCPPGLVEFLLETMRSSDMAVPV